MPRFVVLFHQFPAGHEQVDHWDLMLEEGDSLLTWRLHERLSEGRLKAKVLAPHRSAYLDYEGEVSGDRGHVRQVVQGTYQWTRENRQVALLIADQGSWVLEFNNAPTESDVGAETEIVVKQGPMT